MCDTDAFSISAPNAMSSPVICGVNTGYHSMLFIYLIKKFYIFVQCYDLIFLVILDNEGSTCQTVNFMIGTDSTTTRSWNIRVTQYTCSEHDTSGPPGCLQYYTQTANYIQKYLRKLYIWKL